MANALLPVPHAILSHHLEALTPAFREWAKNRRLPPVLLITGTAGIGKRHMAHYLSQWILCHQSPFAKQEASAQESLLGDLWGGEPSSPNAEPSLAPCESCPACQKAQHGNWVDFEEIQNGDEEGGLLKVDLFRDLKATQGFGAHESAYRVTLIPDAERMTEQAANSLLKLLEEPPASWILVLTAADAATLLPTLVSRCLRIRLRPLPKATLSGQLQSEGLPPEQADLLAQLTQGSWLRAKNLQDPEFWAKREELMSFVVRPAPGLAALTDWAASQPEHFRLLTDQLESLCLDLVRWSLNPAQATSNTDWENPDAPAKIQPFLQQLSQKGHGALKQAREFWISQALALAQSRLSQRVPLNRKLQLQALLLPWLEAV